jgi:hypothetical protein
MLKAKPKIEFNEQLNSIRFEGIFIIKSYWEEDDKLVQRVKDFIKNRKQVLLEFSLFYLDSVSRKIFFEMFVELKDLLLKIEDLTIRWLYETEDETIYELGDVLTKFLNIPFEFINLDE